MYTLYNTTESDWKALEAIKKAAYEEGRIAGFNAGFAAAQGQPAAKIEEAYQQGVAAASKLVLLRKNGVGY